MTACTTDPFASLAQLLTAPAAFACGSPAGALVVAVAAAITGADIAAVLRLPDPTGRERRLVVQRGHVVEVGGVALTQLVRFAGAVPVEAGTAERCHAADLGALLADGAACGLFVEPEGRGAGELVGMAEFVWACRLAGVPSYVMPAGAPLAALDAGADLVLVDAAATYGGTAIGLLAGRADLIEACRLQVRGIGALFPASAEAVADVVKLARAAATDLGAGFAVADL